MSVRAKKSFLFFGILTGIVCACLGLETKHSNHLGWALLLAATAFIVIGCIQLGTLLRPGEGSRQKTERSLWLPWIGVLLVSLVTPLEFMFMPAVLPRSDATQDLGLIFFAGGLIFSLFTFHSAQPGYAPFHTPNPAQPQPAFPLGHALVRTLLTPAAVSLLLLVIGLGIGYSSFLGILLLFFMVLPGLLHRMAPN